MFRIKWDDFYFMGYFEEQGVDRQRWSDDPDEAATYESFDGALKDARELGLPVVIVRGKKK